MGRRRRMDYMPRGKFGDCSFSRFGSIVPQTHRHTDADERFTPTTLVGVGNNNNNNNNNNKHMDRKEMCLYSYYLE